MLLFNILVCMVNIEISRLFPQEECLSWLVLCWYYYFCWLRSTVLDAAELEMRVVDGWETRLCGNFILFVITCTSITSGQNVDNSALRTGLDGTISGEALNFGRKNKSLNNLVG